MESDAVLFQVDPRGVATITLNRPDKHNCFDENVIAGLTAAVAAAAGDDGVRVVVLAANGKSFCAGADLEWMRRTAGYGHDENYADARKLADLLQALYDIRVPTLALVQGAAFGGGAGLIACCDIALAVAEATFAFSEVKLGLIPATISPFVVDAIGPAQARRYFLTAERFDAATARDIGLVHEVVAPPDALSARADAVIGQLLAAAPGALTEAKRLIADVEAAPRGSALMDDLARRIAERRASPEGREGVAAFLDRRKPDWAS